MDFAEKGESPFYAQFSLFHLRSSSFLPSPHPLTQSGWKRNFLALSGKVSIVVANVSSRRGTSEAPFQFRFEFCLAPGNGLPFSGICWHSFVYHDVVERGVALEVVALSGDIPKRRGNFFTSIQIIFGRWRQRTAVADEP